MPIQLRKPASLEITLAQVRWYGLCLTINGLETWVDTKPRLWKSGIVVLVDGPDTERYFADNFEVYLEPHPPDSKTPMNLPGATMDSVVLCLVETWLATQLEDVPRNLPIPTHAEAAAALPGLRRTRAAGLRAVTA